MRLFFLKIKMKTLFCADKFSTEKFSVHKYKFSVCKYKLYVHSENSSVENISRRTIVFVALRDRIFSGEIPLFSDDSHADEVLQVEEFVAIAALRVVDEEEGLPAVC